MKIYCHFINIFEIFRTKYIKKHKENLSTAITFLLFTYVIGCIKIRIVRKVKQNGKIQIFQLFVKIDLL